MDLMEYQAKELFAKHGVPVTVGTVITSPEEAEAAAEAERRSRRRQGAGEDRWPRQGRRREARPGPAGRRRQGARDPRHGHQGPHRPPRAGRTCRRHRGGVLLLLPARPGQPQLPLHRLHRGRRRDRGDRHDEPRRDRPRSRSTPRSASTTPRPPRSSRPTGFPAVHLRRRPSDTIKKLWTVFVEEDATLVEVNPLVQLADGSLEALDGKVSLDDNAEFRHEDHAALRGHEDEPTRSRPTAKEKGLNYVKLDGAVGIIGNGAGLVMSTLDVVAYAGEKHGGVKPANFLDIGGGASAEVMANGLDIILGDVQVKSVFVNVFGGITACDEVANGIVGALAATRRRGEQAARRTPRRQQRRRGPADPPGREPPAGDAGRTRWTARPTRPPSSRTAEGRGHTDGDLPDRELQGHRPGHDRLRGHEAHPADARLRHRHRRRRQPAQGRRVRRLLRRLGPGVRHRRRGDGQDRRRRVGGVRAAGVHQGRRDRGDRRRHRPGRRDHRGRAGPRHRRVPCVRRGRSWRGHDADHRPQLSRPDQPRQVQRRHHPGRHHQGRPHRSGVEVGHADLPDDVRAAGLRLLVLHRHRRRPDHRDDPHRRARGLRGRPRDRCDRDDRRDRWRRRGARRGLHQGPRHQAGRRLRRRLHRARGQDDGPRRRHRLGLLRAPPRPRRRPSRPSASRSARRRPRPPS